MGTIGRLNNLGNSGKTQKVNNGREVLIPKKIYDNPFWIAFKEVSRRLSHAQDNNFKSTKKHN
jgi:hypothetical protein